ncbi:acyl-CoA dehydrogenase [Aeromicrobium sp. SMF47]|uniref:acyl-CoA dehydrogenase family protein n=1 Tax=Aeromicrobium TaxID=2040 RepID=UPI00129E8531|nr:MULTISPECIES: acyl-CoA dehydrogenase family protein [Aeromicrobium]MRJ75123.1 acyl-CoA dehydrogenase [Aeromicrobium yanjiei]MRK02820.1 acyl-CoA dehydrogenase [Aeromicrobium sp. S22]
MQRHLYSAEHETFRSAFREFLEHEAVPYVEDWESAGTLPREFWQRAGQAGYLGFEADPELGGLGIQDFRYNAVIQEEVAASGIANDGFSLHNDIVTPYLLEFTDEEQRRRWLPGFTAGDTITAIAMTEPQAGSDLAAVTTSGRPDGGSIVLNGSKTFITNGSIADLVIVLVRTGEDDGRGMTLVVVEEGTPGMTRGKPLKKAGRRGQDTAEIFFDDCAVPVQNILGEPGRAFSLVKRNLARERLSIAVHAVESAHTGLQLALEHTTMRSTFGRPINRHQAVSHTLAEMHTAVQVARSHVDACVVELDEGRLSAEDAAGAKFWATDLEGAVLDQALQLFGGYGFMDEYPISRRWRDARVQRIYGGANEIMKDIVGRGLTR